MSKSGYEARPSKLAEISCPNCEGTRIESRFEDEQFTYGIGDKAVQLHARIVVYKCADCGFEFTGPDAEISRHEEVCKHLGVLTPAEILRIREAYRFSRAEFAKLTRIGEASLHRWENGLLIQNPAMDSYLRLLSYPENIKRLQEGKAPSALVPEVQPEHKKLEAIHDNASEPDSETVTLFRSLDVTAQVRAEASAFSLRRAAA